MTSSPAADVCQRQLEEVKFTEEEESLEDSLNILNRNSFFVPQPVDRLTSPQVGPQSPSELWTQIVSSHVRGQLIVISPAVNWIHQFDQLMSFEGDFICCYFKHPAGTQEDICRIYDQIFTRWTADYWEMKQSHDRFTVSTEAFIIYWPVGFYYPSLGHDRLSQVLMQK